MKKKKNQLKPYTPNRLKGLKAHTDSIRKTLCWKRVTVSIETLASIDSERGKASRDTFISDAVAKLKAQTRGK